MLTADADSASSTRRRPERVDALRITEIFCSLQGEARAAGARCAFIRLTGCPLRCAYCDTEYAFHGGHWRKLDDILECVAAYRTRHVCVTGGEPLAQPNCAPLVRRLCDAGHEVAVETSGALDISPIDTRASRIVDLKTPASGEAPRNLWSNIGRLTDHDQIKFVLCDRADYVWACQRLAELTLPPACPVWFSPAHGRLDPRQLGDWMVADGVDARLQLQLHKQLWGDGPGR